ncbi:MAG: nucleotide exchange factor GrpE [Deltaproteobacteria bacterium]|nr:nucleotide exchange factor GrpE [Deltaproteobacteria bacterium]
MARQVRKKGIEEKINIKTESDETVKNSDTEKESPELPLNELEKSRQEAADNYDKFLRASAELENYKKRAVKELADAINYGNEKIIKDLLPIIDSLERALDHAIANSEDFDTFVEGLKLIYEKFLKTLEKYGVEKIDAVGIDFDPNFHEAMLQVESEDYEDNKIVEEFERGYLLNGRLLRPVKAAVSKHVTKGKQE